MVVFLLTGRQSFFFFIKDKQNHEQSEHKNEHFKNHDLKLKIKNRKSLLNNF